MKKNLETKTQPMQHAPLVQRQLKPKKLKTWWKKLSSMVVHAGSM
jgi:hypothetical protein